jgi:hypothetical protein
MKRALVPALLLTAVLGLAGWAAGAGPSPGVTFGSPGVLSHDGKLRYLAMQAGRNTLVESVATKGGAVRRSRFLKGWYGVPLVAYDGTAGGLARNGKRLVLYAPPTSPRHQKTRFVVLDTRSLRLRARVTLNGNFAFDALSPEGSLMYLIRFATTPTASGLSYAVRALNLNTGRLYPGAIVDRREPDEKMTGIPLTRIGSRDGSWAYTLYSRDEKSPFVHALHTTHRQAFCIDVPMRVPSDRLGRVRMRTGKGKLVLRLDAKTLATIDTRTFEVSRG